MNPSPDTQTQELSARMPVQPSPYPHAIVSAAGGTGQSASERTKARCLGGQPHSRGGDSCPHRNTWRHPTALHFRLMSGPCTGLSSGDMTPSCGLDERVSSLPIIPLVGTGAPTLHRGPLAPHPRPCTPGSESPAIQSPATGPTPWTGTQASRERRAPAIRSPALGGLSPLPGRTHSWP